MKNSDGLFGVQNFHIPIVGEHVGFSPAGQFPQNTSFTSCLADACKVGMEIGRLLCASRTELIGCA